MAQNERGRAKIDQIIHDAPIITLPKLLQSLKVRQFEDLLQYMLSTNFFKCGRTTTFSPVGCPAHTGTVAKFVLREDQVFLAS